MTDIVPNEQIEHVIRFIRGQRVLLDADLASLYNVTTSVLNQAVRRNLDCFPDDFMFQLTQEEQEGLKSQSVISKRGGRRYAPYAFTEQGVPMLSSILRSPQAVKVNIEIMRAFVRIRQVLASNTNLAYRLDKVERKYHTQDELLSEVIQAIRQMMTLPETPRRRMGFATREEQEQQP